MSDQTSHQAAHPLHESIETTANPNTSRGIGLRHRSIASIKQDVLDEAKMLDESYNSKRAEMSDKGFCNLNFRLRTRNENNIQIEWYLSHFKNGMRTGTTSIKKSRGSHSYDLRLLKSSSPEWMHSLVEDTEIQARKVRKKIETIAKIYALLPSLTSEQKENNEAPEIPQTGDSSFEEFMKNVF
ncbi:conjugative transfer protein MobI(A/C) [Stenotrophomonas ginsengisoli]|uniref:conjugative transfer protein MobI(A/C) n=1 Tax=Stenotrophomonas ginsengisoli TaxID=336566 RepID=UPI000B1876E3|nr:conjugative transfer protein MobI(A/C) [Stenotrophomonas ginsengisoli]